MISSPIRSGRRVGFTAAGHGAIDNLLREMLTVFEEDGATHALRGMP